MLDFYYHTIYNSIGKGGSPNEDIQNVAFVVANSKAMATIPKALPAKTRMVK